MDPTVSLVRPKVSSVVFASGVTLASSLFSESCWLRSTSTAGLIWVNAWSSTARLSEAILASRFSEPSARVKSPDRASKVDRMPFALASRSRILPSRPPSAVFSSVMMVRAWSSPLLLSTMPSTARVFSISGPRTVSATGMVAPSARQSVPPLAGGRRSMYWSPSAVLSFSSARVPFGRRTSWRRRRVTFAWKCSDLVATTRPTEDGPSFTSPPEGSPETSVNTAVSSYDGPSTSWPASMPCRLSPQPVSVAAASTATPASASVRITCLPSSRAARARTAGRAGRLPTAGSAPGW